jgi:hypothetical protein
VLKVKHECSDNGAWDDLDDLQELIEAAIDRSPGAGEARLRVLEQYITSRKALLQSVLPHNEQAEQAKFHRLNELEQLEMVLVRAGLVPGGA